MHRSPATGSAAVTAICDALNKECSSLLSVEDVIECIHAITRSHAGIWAPNKVYLLGRISAELAEYDKQKYSEISELQGKVRDLEKKIVEMKNTGTANAMKCLSAALHIDVGPLTDAQEGIAAGMADLIRAKCIFKVPKFIVRQRVNSIRFSELVGNIVGTISGNEMRYVVQWKSGKRETCNECDLVEVRPSLTDGHICINDEGHPFMLVRRRGEYELIPLEGNTVYTKAISGKAVKDFRFAAENAKEYYSIT
jgi:hypothetical protein